MKQKERFSAARRYTLRKLAVSSAFGAGGFAGLVQAALAANPQQGIRQMKGTVTIDGQPATTGQELLPGQTIATGADGEVVFVIGRSAFLQRENSEFAVEQSAVASAVIPVFRYITGKVLSVFGKGRKKLTTPTATIGIRGTACYIEAEQQSTYFCLCYGTADVTPTGDPAQSETVQTKHHDYPLTIGAAPGREMMAKAKVINHTDDELIMLEALVGRKPPFYGRNYEHNYP